MEDYRGLAGGVAVPSSMGSDDRLGFSLLEPSADQLCGAFRAGAVHAGCLGSSRCGATIGGLAAWAAGLGTASKRSVPAYLSDGPSPPPPVHPPLQGPNALPTRPVDVLMVLLLGLQLRRQPPLVGGGGDARG